MHYLYVGYYVDDQTFNTILSKRVNNMSPARQKFEYNLIKGLFELLHQEIDFVSYVPTDGKVFVPNESHIGDAVIKHFAINKSSGASMVDAEKDFSSYLKEMGEKLNDLVVIMYAVNPVLLRSIQKIRKRYSIRIITICSEVPALRRYGSSIKARIKKRILTYYNQQFDGYILFSAKMKDVIRMNGKPYIVLEGIAPDLTGAPRAHKKNIVMYAGGLAKDNNIRLLIEASRKVKDLDEVWICGAGPDQEYVSQEAQKENSKVRYLGLLANTEVMKLENKAKLLVNLRDPDEFLTNFSFPSKILEYISSGSMVLSSKLGGIPDEYFDYIMCVDPLTIENAADAIEHVFLMDEDEYVRKCYNAQKFIGPKSYLIQSRRIADFCEKVSR